MARDFRAFSRGVEPPSTWLGMVAMDGRRRVGMGTVVWDGEGRAWCFFDRKAHVPISVMHRTARRVIGVLRRVGEPAMYAACDPRVIGSDRWLAGLGFRRSGERVADQDVWVLE